MYKWTQIDQSSFMICFGFLVLTSNGCNWTNPMSDQQNEWIMDNNPSQAHYLRPTCLINIVATLNWCSVKRNDGRRHFLQQHPRPTSRPYLMVKNGAVKWVERKGDSQSPAGARALVRVSRSLYQVDVNRPNFVTIFNASVISLIAAPGMWNSSSRWPNQLCWELRKATCNVNCLP